MPIPSHLVGLHGDECQCGRRKSVRHCPSCGSARVYGYAREQIRTNDKTGQLEQVRLFRCMSCSHRFTDAEREFCDAPPISTKLAAQKIAAIHAAAHQGAALTPDEQRIANVVDTLAPSATSEEKKYALAKLKQNLRVVWSQELLALKQHDGNDAKHPETVEAYIARQLKAIPDEYLKAFGLERSDLESQ